MSKAFGTFSGARHHELADVIGIVIGMRVTKGNDPHIRWVIVIISGTYTDCHILYW